MLLSMTSAAADLDKINVEPQYSRVKLILDDNEKFSYFFLEKPNRLVVDLKNTQRKAKFPKLKNHQHIKSIRGGQRGDDYRLVFDLNKKIDIQIKESWLANKSRKELTIKIKSDSKVAQNSKYYEAGAVKEKTKQQHKQSDDIKDQKRVILIAIDAGHGGSDPGAIGPNGIQEKDVVLGITKELERLLDNEPGFYSKMIRRRDIYLGLRARRDIARDKNADMFISIHADAFPDKAVSGSSVYVLSRGGASSAMAKFLSANENSSDKLGQVDLKGKDALLTEVLVDLAMDGKIQASASAGSFILREMGKVSKLHSKHVGKAPFAVLKMPDIPSVLVETGFISNPDEARKLSKEAYQKTIARAVFDGIRRYFNRYPPEGSYLAWKKNQKI